MRKIILQMMVSADGYFEGPNREIDWHNVDNEFNENAVEFLNTVDTLLFGRVTYELMAGYWPTPFARDDDPIIAERMNNLSKIVFSNTLQKVEWNNSRLIRGNVKDEISKLKNQPGKNIAVFGSSGLSVELMKHGLIDELAIMINPIILGNGKSLLKGLNSRYKLKLLRTKVFSSGNVALYYKPVY